MSYCFTDEIIGFGWANEKETEGYCDFFGFSTSILDEGMLKSVCSTGIFKVLLCKLGLVSYIFLGGSARDETSFLISFF